MSAAYRYLGTSAAPEFDFGSRYKFSIPNYFGMATAKFCQLLGVMLASKVC